MQMVERWVLLFCASTVLSCAAVNQMNLLSPQDEVEIGRQASREVEKEMPMDDDREGVAVWFSTHPPTNERVNFVRNEIEKLPPKPGLETTSDRFKEIRARVKARTAQRKSQHSGK